MSYQPTITETLAEELIDVRAKLAVLKRRETELRDALVSIAAPAIGRVRIPTTAACVQIETRISSRFDAKLLPDHIRNDSAYRVEKTTTYVRTLASASEKAAPRNADDAFAVIERF